MPAGRLHDSSPQMGSERSGDLLKLLESGGGEGQTAAGSEEVKEESGSDPPAGQGQEEMGRLLPRGVLPRHTCIVSTLMTPTEKHQQTLANCYHLSEVIHTPLSVHN